MLTPAFKLTTSAAAALVVMLLAPVAFADPAPSTATTTATDAAPTDATTLHARPRRHAAYLEILGKGGLWGVGYDYQARDWLGFGAVASFYVLDGQRVSSLSPYVALHPLGRGRHRWFVHAGPQLVRVSTPSPVPEWAGTSTTGVGAELCTGYEYRGRVLWRVFVMGAVGSGGATPWLGASIGWTL